jgi:hypothetical protein
VLAVNTTVIAVVAPDDAAPIRNLQAANVRVVQTDHDLAALDRAGVVWDQAQRTKAPYLVHDADPLAWVADAWTQRFDGVGTVGDLEVAVSETLSRWRRRAIDWPDYYLVVDPEGLSPTRRHWLFGVLGSLAPNRVVTIRPTAPMLDHLHSLQPGRWWPALDRVLADVDRVVPDQAGKLVEPSGPPGLVIQSRRP